MADAQALLQAVQAAQEAVTKQSDTVRSLKAEVKDGKVEKSVVDEAIQKLQALKQELEAYEAADGRLGGLSKETFRANLSRVLESRLFYIPSFKIYGSVAGFYDYGPPGCAIKQNITQAWRNQFVLEENMLEVECPTVTPEIVLKASGHVDRFTDFMVRDVKTGECYRADHLLEAALETALENTKEPLSPEAAAEALDLLAKGGELKQDTLGDALKKYKVVAPDTRNDISDPFPFNLMFKTSIGPKGDLTGYLRPETAQGIFVNFRDLLYYKGGKLPFAAAQIGNSYRNEISPRAGLLRVREFTQAEIEHFVNPDDKSHPRFEEVADLTPLLYSRELQMGEEKKPKPMRLGEAVAKGIIANQTLAYFIGRTWLFFKKVGINPQKMRFRQHLQHEMAHYANDCWDGEVETSYGWVECVGLADRSAYDLTAHAGMSKQELTARETFDEPRMVDQLKINVIKKEVGTAFKKDAKAVTDALEGLSECDALELKAKLESAGSADVPGLQLDGKPVIITKSMVTIVKEPTKVTGRTFTPAVIEPSFGIGRIMYCMFEHSFYNREGDEARTVFGFTPLVAPVKATVFPLHYKDPEMNLLARKLSSALTSMGLSNQLDTSGASIGKRYARTDEIGVPYAVTVDKGTLGLAEKQPEYKDTITLRERDSTTQVRVPVDEVHLLVKELVDGTKAWDEVIAEYPIHVSEKEEGKEKDEEDV